MTEIRIGHCTVTPGEIRHDLLGRFKRTGKVRIPKPGEFYLGELQVGMRLKSPEYVGPREILEKVK